ncbi:arabinogalactan peptide 23-like [Durio zibethinus]|uniref:Arabinogalactan peptide 23-like n=1 Tax=Durio zibethinus TaxID=66656 RepID=A0A6P5YRB0_DURZI|nr:arabinogalactan peptide 23-like [Durio zibethinus]
MDMQKISCAVIVAAASMSAVMASTDAPAAAPGPSTASSAVSSTLPVLGSLVGASLVSFFAYYLQ